MGRARHRFFADTLHFLQFLHERALGVKTAGSIYNHDINVPCTGRLDRIEDHG
jgi:hypothetical protein